MGLIKQLEQDFEKLKQEYHHFGVFGVPHDLGANREAMCDWVE